MKRRQFIQTGVAGAAATLVAGRADALKLFPNATDVKWAIVYGTWYGTARDAGIWIGEGLGGIAQVFDVRENPDLGPYDHVVLGTAIQGGKGLAEFEAWVGKNLAPLKKKLRAYYVVCGAMGQEASPQQQTAYIDNYLVKLCETDLPLKKAFAGRITRGLLSRKDYDGLESFHKSIGAPFVDYDHLRRGDCLQFGGEILSRVGAGKK